jgi:hypothetical protein
MGRGIAVDAAGNAVIAGALQGSINFGGGPIVASGSDDVFVARIDPSGTPSWGHVNRDPIQQYARGVALGPGGKIAVTGAFQGMLDFGGACPPLMSAGGLDVFVAVLDSTSVCVWSKRYGDTADQDGRGVAFDGLGNVWASGDFVGTIDFGCGTLLAAGTNDNAYLAELDPTGACVVAKRYGDGSAPGAFGRSVAVDGMGNVLLAGDFGGAIEFGGGPVTSLGSPDAFAVKLPPALLTPAWVQRWGTTLVQQGEAVAVDTAGNAFVTGVFHGTIDFGATMLQSAGGADGFLEKLGP